MERFKNTLGRLTVSKVLVEQKDHGDRLNPNSLRFLLGYIIKDIFDDSITGAVGKLREYGGRYKDRHAGREPKNITGKAAVKLLKDKEYFTYWHLEIMARGLKLPTGALLLISRYFSYKRYDDRIGAQMFVEAMKKMIVVMEENIDKDMKETRDIPAFSKCFDELHDHDSKGPMLF